VHDPSPAATKSERVLWVVRCEKVRDEGDAQ
jgi:hypothetical protein